MKVAVTGAAGYLAGVLLPKLDALPEVESILALDLRPPAPPLAARLSKLRYEPADVRTSDFRRLFAGVDAVVHLAFIVTPIRDETAIFDINVVGSERVFEGAAAAGVRRIVYASSIAAYGCYADHALPLRETSPLRDQREFYYSHTKYLVEEYLDRFERAHPEIAVARLRPGVFVGPGIANPVGELLRERVFFSLFGQPPIQYTWDDDVADAFVLALRAGARGAYLVTTDDSVSSAEAAAILGKLHVRVPKLLVEGLVRLEQALGRGGLAERGWLLASRAPMVACADKIRGELGWKPRCPDSRAVLRRFAELSANGANGRNGS